MNHPTGIPDSIIILLYLPIVLVTAIVLTLTQTSYRRSPLAQRFMLCMVYLLSWEICVVLYYFTPNAIAARFLYDAKLPFVALSSLELFYFVLFYYKLDQKLPRWARALLLAIPIITAVLCLTSSLHPLIRRELTIDLSGPARFAVNLRGPWYWVNAVYCYLLTAGALVAVLTQHRRQLQEMRMASNYMLIAIAITASANLVAMTRIVPTSMDLTLIGTCASVLLMYLAIAATERSGFLYLAREQVFNYVRDLMVITDARGDIVDSNHAARDWLRREGMQGIRRIEDLRRALEEKGAEFLPSEERDGATDLRLPGGSDAQVLTIRPLPIERDGIRLGTLFCAADMTATRALIDRLRLLAGSDTLTGLPNRYSLDLDKATLDTPENLPLSILFGDVNGLKVVNDTLGHAEGDAYLRRCADLLREVCPEGGQAYRVGGDEFILFLPRCPAEQAQVIMEGIRMRAEAVNGAPYALSLSLGLSTKVRREESLDALISEADRLMYEKKRGVQMNPRAVGSHHANRQHSFSAE